MTGKQRIIHAFERRAPLPGQHVPHFELVFYLTMEEFGITHSSQRAYHQWTQMSETERALHRKSCAEYHVLTAERYNHDAIFVHPNPGNFDEVIKLLELIRERSGDEYFTMLHGDATYGVPDGESMTEFAAEFAEEPEKMKTRASEMVDAQIYRAEKFLPYKHLLDGFALCSDYCFNTAPFFRPSQFAEFVTPYLTRLTKAYKDMGFYVMKHTDGNIMPILDQLVDSEPHALHSLDPQGGVDLAEVKKLYGDRVALVGNVNCGLLQTGTDEEVAADVRRSLKDGMPGGGYVFSTSNCVYTGMDIERYRLMHRIWREEGIYT